MRLKEEEIKKALNDLNNWTLKEKKLHKLFKFKTFSEALAFMVRVGIECEKMNHHPQWYNVYGNVEVNLSTHSVNGITELDIKLAKIMDNIF